MEVFYLRTFVLFLSFFIFFRNAFSLNFERHPNKTGDSKISPEPKRKKIIIFSSRGGGGHTAVSKAIGAYLGDEEYDINVINFFVSDLFPLDPMRKMTSKKYTGVDFFDLLLRHRWTRLTNSLCSFGKFMTLKGSGRIEKRVYSYLEQYKPDMLISVIPLANLSFLNAAKRLNIPFLIVTNDLDTSNYINGLVTPDYEKFKYTLPFDDAAIKSKIAPAKFKEDQVVITGFPTRDHFFEKKDTYKIREQYNIPQGKKTVMILMGAAGSDSTYCYVKKIARMKLPLHLIICLGRNEILRKKIERLKMRPQISKTTLGFTERISDLMAVSDLLITKSGPNSISEALYMNVPMLVDGTRKSLFWERLNMDFVKERGLGEVVRSYSGIEKFIKKIVFDENNNRLIRNRMRDFKKEYFGDKIRTLVKNMLV